MDPSCKLSADSDEPLSDPTVYRRLLGKLNYLTHTRPDISYTMQYLSQYMQDPRLPHSTASIRVLSYLQNNPDQGLFMRTDPSLTLLAFCDADWGSCLDSLGTFSV